MNILLVEDEVHKRDEMLACVQEVYHCEPAVADSVSSAVLSVIANDYDLIILDMALSTFGETAGDNRKGHDQAQGGIEVIRALKSAKKSTNILIVTQYHDFYIASMKIKLKDSPKIILEKYNQNIIGAILYTYKSRPVLQKIMAIMRNLK